jgi:hypothetical protein
MTREHLPHRRPCETISFEHEGHRYKATVGYYADGRIGEIFLVGGKPGTALDHSCRDAAVATSLALQSGVDIEVLRKAVTRLDGGEPAGPLGVLLDRL